MIKLGKRLPNAQSVSKVAAKVYQQLTKGTSKLSVQQREATPNKIKPCPKRDLSPGSPDSETLSPEHKRPDFDYSSFSSMNSLNSSMISMHSSDFDTDTCSQIEKEITQDPPTTPRKPEVNGDDGTTVATATAHVTDAWHFRQTQGDKHSHDTSHQNGHSVWPPRPPQPRNRKLVR